MMYSTVILIILLYFSALTLTFYQDDYIIKHEFGHVEYYNKNAMEYFIVNNVKPNRTYRAYSIFTHALVDIDGDTAKGNVKAFRFVNNHYHHKIVDVDIKICDGLKANYLGVMDFLKNTNISYCPIKKGYYALINFNVDEHRMPPFIPAGRYKLQLTGFYRGYLTLKASGYAEVIYKVKIK